MILYYLRELVLYTLLKTARAIDMLVFCSYKEAVLWKQYYAHPCCLETIDYYNENDTDYYLLLLDASKAFDRVEYVKLFNTLRDRKMCPVVLRMLINIYII